MKRPKPLNQAEEVELLGLIHTQGEAIFQQGEDGYLGVASDGTIVSLGYFGRALLNYLRNHPSPEHW